MMCAFYAASLACFDRRLRAGESKLHALLVRAQLCVRLECNKSTCYKSGLETTQLVLIDILDYETKLKLNQPLDFEQVVLPRVCFL